MKKVLKTALSSVLILTLLFSIISCAGGNGNDTADTSQIKPPSSDSGYQDSFDVPEGLKFDGSTFTVLMTSVMTNGVNPFKYSEYQATVVDEATFALHEKIKSLYDVTIENIESLGKVGDDLVVQDALAENNTYDSLLVSAFGMGSLTATGHLADLADYQYINLNNSWWDHAAQEDLTIGDKLFFTTGDISWNDKDYTIAVIFNKQLAKEKDIPDLYQTVYDGKWTYDTFAQYSRLVSEDMNGDSVMDSRDRYGLIMWDDTILFMISGAEGSLASMVDGKVELTLNTERNMDLTSKYVSLISESCCINFQHTSGGRTWENIFREGDGLFLLEYMKAPYVFFRDHDIDYGFLPLPKYDEDQEKYSSSLAVFQYSMYGIPAVVNNPEMSGAISEALAYYGQDVTTAYYDRTLIGKTIRDDESIETLDIIFANRMFDVGQIYRLGDLNTMLMDLIRNKNASGFASGYAAYKDAAQQAADKLNLDFAS